MFTFGFYDSMNGDRRYNATQMSAIFDGIIEDGVFSNVGEMFAVVPGTGLQVIVKTGRAWFKHTWNLNDAWLPMNLDSADPIRSRIDSVVLEIDSNISARQNSLKIIIGTPAINPTPPTMKHEDGIDQYRLADVTIGPAATYITAANIAIKVGQGETPFVTAPLKAADITDLFKQWGKQFSDELQSWDDEFYVWFNNLKLQLTEDVVTNLQNQIDDRVKIADKASINDINSGDTNKWVPASEIKNNLQVPSDLSQKFGLTGTKWPNDLFQVLNAGSQVPATLSQKYGLSGVKWPNDLFSILSESTLYKTIPKYTSVKLSELSEGTVIKLEEDGTDVDFYIAKHNYESSLNGTGRTLVVRKYAYNDARSWNDTAVNTYATSTIDSFLNGDYKNLLGERVRAAMGTTRFYYTPGNNNNTITTLERSVFLLSMTELADVTTPTLNAEGSALPIIDLLKIAYVYDNVAVAQWSRSPVLNNTTSVWFKAANGSNSTFNCRDYKYHPRPVFCLSSNFLVYRDNGGNYHAEQEYYKTITDILGNKLLEVPYESAQIRTGTYVGTGNKDWSLTFDFEPIVVFISSLKPKTAVSSSSPYMIPTMLVNRTGFAIATSVNNTSTNVSAYFNPIDLTWNDNVLTLSGPSAMTAFNYTNENYYWFALVIKKERS